MCFSDVFSVDFVLCVEVDDVLSVCWEIDGMYKVGVYIIDVSFFVVKNFNLDKVVFLYGIFVYGSFEVFYYNVMLFFYVSIELCSLFFDEEWLVILIMFYLNEDGIEVEWFEIYCSIVMFCCKLIFD